VAAEIIGTIESPKGDLFNIKWDSDSREIFVGKDEFFCLGKAYSDDRAIAKVYGMVRNFARGKTRNFDNEIPKSLMDCLKEFRTLIQSRMKEYDPDIIGYDLDIIGSKILRKGSSIPDSESKVGRYTIGNEPVNFSEVQIPPEFFLLLEELEEEEESSTPISIDVALAAEKILERNNKEKEEFKTTKKSKEQKRNKNGS
jgi:hypothetical protein